MRQQTKDRDGTGDQHLARDDAITLLYTRDVAHGLDLVLTRPALGREQGVEAIRVSARIGVGHNLPAFLVVGGVSDPPLDLIR